MKLVEQELKDIFDENEQDFDGKSRTLSHFVAIEEHIAEKAILRGRSLDFENLNPDFPIERKTVAKSLLLTALYSLQFSAFT